MYTIMRCPSLDAARGTLLPVGDSGLCEEAWTFDAWSRIRRALSTSIPSVQGGFHSALAISTRGNALHSPRQYSRDMYL